MGRKPNYKFERLERQRAKAAKKASKLEAREKLKVDDEGPALADTPEDGDSSDQ